MDINEMLQALIAAEFNKLNAEPEPAVAAKAFDTEAFASALSAQLGAVVDAAVERKVAEIKAASQEPKQVIEKALSLETDPARYLAEKSKRGEQFTDAEKRIAYAMLHAVLTEGMSK